MSQGKFVYKDYLEGSAVSVEIAVNTVVSENFRNLLLEVYPGLKIRAAYRKLAAYLLFSTFFDEQTGNVVVPWETLANLEGKEEQVRNHHYNGTAFLESFQARVMSEGTFNWSEPRYIKQRARVVDVAWDQRVLNAIEHERTNRRRGTRRVFFVSGRVANRKEMSKFHKRMRQRSQRLTPINHPAIPVIRYLADRSERIYRDKVSMNIGEARATVDQFPVAPPNVSPWRRNQHRVLDQLMQRPKPIYVTSFNGNTDRIFATPSGYMGLKKQVRNVLLSGWYDFDIRNAQLAICAHLWDVPTAVQFLNTGVSIWDELMRHLRISSRIRQTDPATYGDIKGSLKATLYSCMFGMAIRDIRFRLNHEYILWQHGHDVTQRFLSHPVVSALLEAREVKLSELRSNGYAETCFGRRIPIESYPEDARSALAQQAQALELELLLPVIQVAQRSNKEAQIVLWCHDGFVAAIRQASRGCLWRNRIVEAVKGRAIELGMDVEMEVEQL